MENFLGEIRLTSFGFPAKGWAVCAGQLMPIQGNEALFSILGITYGGDGQTTFALPNLQTRVPLGMGTSPLGQTGGETLHALTIPEMPAHSHVLTASTSAATALGPANNLLAAPAAGNVYGTGTDVSLAPSSVSTAGNDQGHENMPPYLVINYMIALVGIYPVRS